MIFPLMKDIKRLDKYLDDKLPSILVSSDAADYRELAKVLLSKVILFNRKRRGETSLLLVADFERALRHQDQAFNEDRYNSLSDAEQRLVKDMFRIEFVGKRRGRGMSVNRQDAVCDEAAIRMRSRHTTSRRREYKETNSPAGWLNCS